MFEEQLLTKEKLAALLESDAKKDLHIHTFYSDGAFSPAEIIDMWSEGGFELISITDHDGIDGYLAGREHAAETGMTLIPGIEFDSADPLGTDMHILGYGYDHTSPALIKALDYILRERTERNELMRTELSKLGYEITMQDLYEINEGRFIGKPTFGFVMMKKGYVHSMQEAFSTVFREPQIQKICKVTLTSEAVVDLIHEAGGLAVLAHPMEQRRPGETYVQFFERLFVILDTMRAYGIDGIECYHPSADDVQAETLRQYASAHGLIVTRGSDFHAFHTRRDYSRYHRP